MKKLSIVITFLFSLIFFVYGHTQPKFKLEIDGIIKDEENGYPLENSKIEILSGGSVTKTFYTTVTGKFVFEFEPEEEFIIRCSKEKYVSKMITVSTKDLNLHPSKTDDTFKFPIAVRLFKEMPDIDVSVLNNPIGAIFYEKSAREFDYTVDKVLKKRLEKLQEEVEKKIKQKQDQEKAEAEKNARDSKEKAMLDEKIAKEKKRQEERLIEEEKKKKETDALAAIEAEKQRKLAEIEAEKQNKLKQKQDAEEKAKQEIKEKKEKEEAQKNKAMEEARARLAAKKSKENDSVPIASNSNYIGRKTGPVIENVRQTIEEGVNYTIIHTFCLYNGDPCEFKKIMFVWGGVYFKKNNYDISDLTYYLEMRSVYPEGIDEQK